jgi:hypothetical protein
MQRGTVPSLAEGLIGAGAQAVLGWGRPVLDRDGTAAAAALYGELAAGKSLLAAVAQTMQTLLKSRRGTGICCGCMWQTNCPVRW